MDTTQIVKNLLCHGCEKPAGGAETLMSSQGSFAIHLYVFWVQRPGPDHRSQSLTLLASMVQEETLGTSYAVSVSTFFDIYCTDENSHPSTGLLDAVRRILRKHVGHVVKDLVGTQVYLLFFCPRSSRWKLFRAYLAHSRMWKEPLVEGARRTNCTPTISLFGSNTSFFRLAPSE